MMHIYKHLVSVFNVITKIESNTRSVQTFFVDSLDTATFLFSDCLPTPMEHVGLTENALL